MSKALILIIGLVACTFAASPLDTVKEIIQNDACGIHGMETIRPKLENKLQEVKSVNINLLQNPNDFTARAELMALIDDAKSVVESCQINQKVEKQLGDAVEAAGVAFLLASNCFKDVGIVLLLADTIVQDPTDWTNDVIITIFGYILGRQGYADCSKFIHFVI